MKRDILKFTVLFIAILMFASCKEIDSTFEKYVVPGGIIYPGKVISPLIFSGHNRVKISWLVGPDPSVVKARIFWNNYVDSVEVDIPKTADTIQVIIDNLPEKFYSFFIKTYNLEGNSSVAVEVLGPVYGEYYQSSLNNRPIISAKMDAQQIVTIKWGGADLTNGAFATEVAYTKFTGEAIIKRFGINESSSVLSDYKPETTIKHRTVYLPDSTCIDTFYTAFSDPFTPR